MVVLGVVDRVGNAVADRRIVAALHEGRYDFALALFVVAAISDGVDGFLAKHFNWTSELGKFLDPLADKWAAFGWETREIDGHDVDALDAVLSAVPLTPGKPTCVVAHTVKGKGVSFMEDKLKWHYSSPKGDELTRALDEIGN